VPRRFAVAVLAAWTASAAAIFVNDVLHRIANGWSIGPSVPFAFAVVVLAAAVVPFATSARRESA